MDFDRILEEIGGLGRTQLTVAGISFACQMLLNMTTFLQMFMQGDDHYRCLVGPCENLTSASYDSDWLAIAIPYVHDEKSGKTILDKCHMFKPVTSDFDNCTSECFDDQKNIPCTNFIYKSTRKSLIKEWNLTCNRKYMLTASMSGYMAGFLVGVVTIGYISDRIGRRKTILGSVLVNVLCNALVIFSVNFYMYAALRFFIGASMIGSYTTFFVLLSEILDVKSRHILGLVAFGERAGEFTLVGLAYYIRNWKYLQASVSIFSAVMLLSYWLPIESPKWLISQGRYEEAREVIEKFAKWQGKKVSAELLEIPVKDVQIEELKQVKLTPLDLFKTYVTRKRMMVISVIWLFDSLIAYGISLGTKNMPGSLYVNFACLAAGSVVGTSISTVLIKYSRRMLTMCLGMFATGVILLINLAIAPDLTIAIAALAMIGRLIMSVNFGMTYVYTAELFPTPLRSTAVGTGSMFSRAGGILAPIVAGLVEVWHPLPVMIMGTCCFIGSIIILFLPETLNKPLPSTIEEIERTRDNPNFIQKLWRKLTSEKKPENDVVLKTITKTTDL